MKQIPYLAAFAAAMLLLSCGKETVPVEGVAGLTKSALYAEEGTPVITFHIQDAYPVYYARASRAVPCDVLVYDRHGHVYPMAQGQSCSEPQWDIIEDNRAPDRRECDVAVIVVRETGEKFSTTLGGTLYIFRIGSYD